MKPQNNTKYLFEIGDKVYVDSHFGSYEGVILGKGRNIIEWSDDSEVLHTEDGAVQYTIQPSSRVEPECKLRKIK